MFSRVWHLLQRLFDKQRVERDLDDEVRGYFDTLADRGMARGLSREAAQRAVRVQFDGPEQVKEKVREARMGMWIETTLQDIRYACRTLSKSPGFTFFAILTIALALGANAAIFSLVDGVLLKSSGYSEPERMVVLFEKRPDGNRNGISAANYLDWAKQSRSASTNRLRVPSEQSTLRSKPARSAVAAICRRTPSSSSPSRAGSASTRSSFRVMRAS